MMHQQELNAWQNIFGKLNRRIVRDLQQMINCYNPYAALYHSVCDLLNSHLTQDVGLVLKTSGEEIDSRCYNVPTGTDMVIIIPVENENQPLNKNIVIYKNKHSHPLERDLISIDDKHPMYDPLLYVLMFPFGDKGWELKCKCTQLQYYAYRLMMHSGNTFNIAHRMGDLFQQYIVNMYSKVEAARLLCIRCNQSKLHAEVYQGLANAICTQDGNVDGT